MFKGNVTLEPPNNGHCDRHAVLNIVIIIIIIIIIIISDYWRMREPRAVASFWLCIRRLFLP